MRPNPIHSEQSRPAARPLVLSTLLLSALAIAISLGSCGTPSSPSEGSESTLDSTPTAAISADASAADQGLSDGTVGDKLATRTSTNLPKKDTKVTRSASGSKHTAEEIKGPYSTVSPWRYIVTSPEMLRFAKLVASSDYGRTIHAGGYILLAPENSAFDHDKGWKALLRPEKKSQLNAFIEQYVLEGPPTGKMLEGRHTNLAGDDVEILKKEGDLFLGDGHLASRQVATGSGLVVPLTTLIGPIEHED